MALTVVALVAAALVVHAAADCPAGRYGPACDTTFCAFAQPCANGGTCFETTDRVEGEPLFVCLCPPGLYGPTCGAGELSA
jgi:hypothetical protein